MRITVPTNGVASAQAIEGILRFCVQITSESISITYIFFRYEIEQSRENSLKADALSSLCPIETFFTGIFLIDFV